MPAKSQEHVELYKSAIRSELVRDVRITGVELVKRLDAQGFHLDREYATKLRDKILRERMKKIDRRTEMQLRNEFFDVIQETMRRMFDILVNPYSLDADKIAAAKEIREAYTQMLGGKADLAIIRGDIVINNNYQLPPAKRTAVVEALERFGYLPNGTAATIQPEGTTGDSH